MSPTRDEMKAAVQLGRLSGQYAQSRLLHSAVEVGVFNALATGPASEPELREELNLDPAFSRDFLNGLVALGLLNLDGGRYRNSEQAQVCLVSNGPLYLGDSVKAAGNRHYATWGTLTRALRGEVQKPSGEGGSKIFKDLYKNPDAARKFLAHMDSSHAPVGPQLAEFVGWDKYQTFVDVGGARGSVAAEVMAAHPHLRGTVFELPEIEPFFWENMARHGVSDRASFRGGDFFSDPLPAADVLIFGHVLHDWTADERSRLVKRACQAVCEGGAIVIYDQMLDDDNPELFSILGSIQVRLTTGGSEYTIPECRAMVENAGFTFSAGRRITTIGNDYVLVATKAAAGTR